MNTTCPPAEALRRYQLGNFSDAEGSEIEMHLAECRDCEETLAEFDETNDSLLRHLPMAAMDLGVEGTESGWLERLKRGPASVTADEPHSETGILPTIQGLDAYELTGVLGKGGMGVVYRARHRHLDRPVALKVVRPKLVSAAEARRRFQREIRILGGLTHPGIVSATDAGQVGPAAYLVMELVDGADFSRIVRGAGPLTVGEACEVARKMAMALAAAHAAGAIHRDIKPSNVMVDRVGNVKLLDFGLAHGAEQPGEDHREASRGQFLGTLDYMSPEQADGGPVTCATDLYGLGATLFFLLTGRPPRAIDRRQPLYQQLKLLANEAAPILSEVRADVPSELSDLVAQLLSGDADERPSDAAQVAEQLTAWADPPAARRLPELIPSDVGQSGQGEAFASLSELLEAQPATQESGTQAMDTDHSKRRSTVVFRLFGLCGLVAALCLGILLLLETPEGTLRIESEVAGIHVEVLREDELVEAFRIDRNEHSTELRAGKYRIRLAGEHDGLSLTPESIELRRGEKTVARITRLDTPLDIAAAPNGVASKAVMQDVVPSAEVLFQGEPHSVWQKRFDNEVNPVSKLEAAQALVTIAQRWPAMEQIARIVAIGGELLDDRLGERAPRLALQSARSSSFRISHLTSNTFRELKEEWDSLLRLVDVQLMRLPSHDLARHLVNSARDNAPAESAFASLVLATSNIRNRIGENQRAADVVLRELRRSDLEELNQASLLIRANYVEHASETAREELIMNMTSAGRELVEVGVPEGSSLFASAWIEAAGELEVDPRLSAQVALRQLVDVGSAPRHFSGSYFGREFAYSDPLTDQLRERTGPLYGEWIGAVNHWLTDHRDNAPPETTAAVIDSLHYVLRGRAAEDDWDVGATARILADLLKEYFVEEGTEASGTEQGIPAITNPHDLMAYIVLCDGEIPALVIEGQPASRAVRDQLSLLEQLLNIGLTEDQLRRDTGRISGVLQMAPYHTVKLAIEARQLPAYMTILELIDEASTVKRHHTRHHPDTIYPPIEPLLLLAIAAELTGVSEEQDDRIASLFDEPHPARLFVRHIRDALGSRYSVRQTAEKWLRRMKQRSKSKTLSAHVEKLLPEILDANQLRGADKEFPPGDEGGTSLATAAEDFNRQTAEARRTLFSPPIPDLTAEQLREGFAGAAETYRSLGEDRIAQTLRRIAHDNQLPEELRLSATGPISRGESGETLSRQIVPAVILPIPSQSDRRLIPLRSLELIYRMDGPSSTDYGVGP